MWILSTQFQLSEISGGSSAKKLKFQISEFLKENSGFIGVFRFFGGVSNGFKTLLARKKPKKPEKTNKKIT